ncbi:MAG: MerR family transcriptional regulator [Actinomycetota bacterium]
MAEDPHQSIGEVLSLLKEEHADVTISKIRFLESQGLITPERTPSGYRKFYREDVDRLRWILTQQRDNFLPLKVIKRRLAEDDFDPATELPEPAATGPLPEPSLFADRETEPAPEAVETPSDDAAAGEAATDPRADEAEPAAPSPPAAAEARPASITGSVSMTAGELAEATGTDLGFVGELEKLGLIAPIDAGTGAVFDDEALVTTRAAAAFRDRGMEVRHLRMYKVAADRESGLLQQLRGAALSRGGQAAAEARAEIAELIAQGEVIRRSLLRRELGLDD